MSIIFDLIAPVVSGFKLRLLHKTEACPVCLRSCRPYDEVDFNKSCLELNGTFLPSAGTSVVYYRCGNCGFCFAPQIARWSHSLFKERIYNGEYSLVDPDYIQARPVANAQGLAGMFGEVAFSIRHLDYGGGNGLLSKLLCQKGWASESYDPFANEGSEGEKEDQFDLVTCYEVFEHVPDPRKLIGDISRLVKPDGIVLFSTLISDGELTPDGHLAWWYAAPRNGHISLFSRRSLVILAQEYGFKFGSFSNGSHCMWRKLPPWAEGIIFVEG